MKMNSSILSKKIENAGIAELLKNLNLLS